MKRNVRCALLILPVVLAMLLVVPSPQAHAFRAKSIIFMVPDGMGLADVTAARIFKNGPNGDLLSFEKLRQIGYQRTHAKNSTVTDSAAAASAWASGEKYNNGEISCHDDDSNGSCDGEQVPTILEIAKMRGKATGLVATSDITHATPAAFGAHVHNRKCEEEIARQYINEVGVDVLLGGGIAANRSSCQLTDSAGDWLTDLLDQAQAKGYAVLETESEMNGAVAGGASKILGLFKDGGKTPETYRVDSSLTYPDEEPTLAEMTAAALAVLEENRNGFFLMVEGSQIDWEDHANNVAGQIGETLAFDEAVQVVLDWIDSKPRRRLNTLLVVIPDHETGGFAINGPYGTLSAAGEIVEDGWTTGEHTASDVLIWSQGPGSWKLGKALDNTDLYHVMKEVLR